MKILQKIFDIAESPTIKLIVYFLLFFLITNIFLFAILKINLNTNNIIIFYILLVYLNLYFLKDLHWDPFSKNFSIFKIIIMIALLIMLIRLRPTNIHIYIWVILAYIFLVFEINPQIILILAADTFVLALFNYSILWYKFIWFLFDYSYYFILIYIILWLNDNISLKNIKITDLFKKQLKHDNNAKKW